MPFIAELVASLRADTDQFERGIDNAKTKIEGAGRAMEGVSVKTIALGTALGNLAVGAIGGLANAGVGVLKDTLNNVAGYERLGMSLEALQKREIVNEATVKQRIYTGTKLVQVAEQEVNAHNGKAVSADKAAAAAERLQNAQVGLPALTDRITLAEINLRDAKKGKKESDEHFIARTNVMTSAIATQKESLGDLQGVIDNGGRDLKTKVIPAHEDLIRTYREVEKVTKTDIQIKKEAKERAQDLLLWTQKLGIESPFTQNDVAQSFKMALTYGFQTTEAKRLTTATLDFAAATGASGDTMQRAMLALGQIKSRGKVAGQELNQLSEAGINVREILAKAFNKTTAEIMKMTESGAIPAGKAIEAIMASLEKDFKGAAKEQAGTFSGLLSSFADLKAVSERDLLMPAFEAIKPALQSVIDMMQAPDFREAMQTFGTNAGLALGNVLTSVMTFGTTFQRVMDMTGDPIQALKRGLALILPENWVTTSNTIFTGIQKIRDEGVKLFDAFQSGGVVGLLYNIFPPAQAADIAVAFEKIRLFAVNAFNEITGEAKHLWEVFQKGGVRGVLDDLLPAGTVSSVIQSAKDVKQWVTTAITDINSAWLSAKPTIDTIGTVLGGIFTSVGDTVQRVMPHFLAYTDWLASKLPGDGATGTGFISGTLLPAITGVGNFISQTLIPALGDFEIFLATNIPLAIDTITKAYDSSLRPMFQWIGDFIADPLVPIFTTLNEILFKLHDKIFTPMAAGLEDHVLPVFKNIGTAVSASGVFGKAMIYLHDTILTPLTDGFALLKLLLNEVKTFLEGISKTIDKMTLPPWLQRHSPSDFELVWMNTADHLERIKRVGLPTFRDSQFSGLTNALNAGAGAGLSTGLATAGAQGGNSFLARPTDAALAGPPVGTDGGGGTTVNVYLDGAEISAKLVETISGLISQDKARY